MKYLKYFLIGMFCVLFCSCYTTNNTIISQSANIEKYNFATISQVMSYTGAASLMDIEVRLFDVLSLTRLKMIGEKELGSLSKIQTQQLLLIKYSATQSDEESVVSINFIDYVTGRPVASCRGSFGLGISREHDMNVAIDNVLEQVKKLFRN